MNIPKIVKNNKYLPNVEKHIKPNQAYEMGYTSSIHPHNNPFSDPELEKEWDRGNRNMHAYHMGYATEPSSDASCPVHYDYEQQEHWLKGYAARLAFVDGYEHPDNKINPYDRFTQKMLFIHYENGQAARKAI
jgi:hypothetical protein